MLLSISKDSVQDIILEWLWELDFILKILLHAACSSQWVNKIRNIAAIS